MKLSNEVVLRPRFQLEINLSSSEIMNRFASVKSNAEGYSITQVDSHVFIRLPREEQSFWAPQLHLEAREVSDENCVLHGFFGPNPTIWTLFIFLHVVVGSLFFANLVWLYSNVNLGSPFSLQIGIGIGLIAVWIALYIGGTIGKKKGKPGLQSLYAFMLRTLED